MRPRYQVSICRNVLDKWPRQVDMTISEIVDVILTTMVPLLPNDPDLKKSKQRLPLLSPNIFDGNGKKKSNLVKVTGIGLDYDDGKISYDEGKRWLVKSGLIGLIYTTPGHTDGHPKWRILLFLSRPYDPGEVDWFRRVSKFFPRIEFDPSTETQARGFFCGSVEGRSRSICHKVEEGTYLDNDDIVAERFSRYGEENFDPDEALRKMEVGKDVNATMLRCVGYYVSRGWNDLDIVEKLVAAALAMDEDWDADEQEREVRSMISRMRSKDDEKVVNLGEVRQRRQKQMPPGEGPRRSKKARLHVDVAEAIVAELATRSERLMWWAKVWCWCRDGVWSIDFDDKHHDPKIREMIREAVQAAGHVPGNHIVSETISHLAALTLSPDGHKWDSHGLTPVRNGLLDPRTRELTPYEPDHYATYRSGVTYDLEAQCPTWVRMVDERWPGDRDTQRAFQEAFGLPLHRDRPKNLKRVPLLVGDTNAGKTGALTVFGALYKSETGKIITDNIIRINKDQFGLQSFVTDEPWVADEVFGSSGKWEESEKVKSLIDSAGVSIELKRKGSFSKIYRGAMMWGSNAMPRFAEMTQAVSSRLAIFECHVIFDSDHPTGVALEVGRYRDPPEKVVAEELSGVLNWSLDGMDRAVKRGYFLMTEKLRQASEALEDISNPVRAFLRDCIEYDHRTMVRRSDVYAAYFEYWRNNHAGKPMPTNRFWDAMKIVCGDLVALDRDYLKMYGEGRFAAGIKLSESGLTEFDAHLSWSSNNNQGARVIGVSNTAAEVNRPLSDHFAELEVVRVMVHAHQKRKNAPAGASKIHS